MVDFMSRLFCMSHFRLGSLSDNLTVSFSDWPILFLVGNGSRDVDLVFEDGAASISWSLYLLQFGDCSSGL